MSNKIRFLFAVGWTLAAAMNAVAQDVTKAPWIFAVAPPAAAPSGKPRRQCQRRPQSRLSATAG